MGRLNWHHRLATLLGYDMARFEKQITMHSHLRAQIALLEIDVVLDVGANVGQHAMLLRDLGYRGRIVSFAPASNAFAKLREAAAADPLWQVHNLALSDQAGEATMDISGTDVFSSLHPHSAYGKVRYGRHIEVVRNETIRTERLDTFLASELPEFDTHRVFLKMDTQGHDMRVFAGAGTYQGRFKGLQSELSVKPLYEGVPDYLEALLCYQQAGYKPTGIYANHRDHETGQIIELDCILAAVDIAEPAPRR